MKAKIGLLLMVLVLGLILWTGKIRAQGFSAVLEKLNNIDNRLNELEEKNRELQTLKNRIDFIPISELAEATKTINTLKSEIEALKKSLPQEDDSELPEIKEAIVSLRSDVNSLADESNQAEQFEFLANDLRGLVGELRNTFSAQDEIGNEITVGEDIPLEVSGFGDVYSVSSQGGGSGDDFAIGQVEVDLETSIDNKIVIGAAIAFDAETETFGLGAFTVDFHLWDSEGGHFQPVNGIDHSGIIAGQFDVPFGIDWHVYPSIDRKLITAPLVVESTHDGWNDYGVMGYLENPNFNAVLYGANGFSYENGVDINNDPIEVPINFSTGGRIGITPYEHIEIGGSYAEFFNERSNLDMSLAGADLQITYMGFSAKGEYIVHTTALESNISTKNTGYYAQGLYDFGPYFVVARYGVFSPDEDGTADFSRTSFGVGWVPRDAFQVRYEYEANSDKADDASYFQLVVGF